MNINFENNFIQLCKDNNCLFDESLTSLSGKTLAIDAEILLRKVGSNVRKSLQEGHSSLDMSV